MDDFLMILIFSLITYPLLFAVILLSFSKKLRNYIFYNIKDRDE